MVQTISLDKQPNQKFTVYIENKKIGLEFITRGLFLYANIKVEDEKLFDGIICLNGNNLIQYPNAKLKGKLYFIDTQGNEAPVYEGFNERWVLTYEEENV